MKTASLRVLAAAIVTVAGIVISAPAFAQGTFTLGSGTSLNCDLGANGTYVDSKSCTVGSVSATMTAWGFTSSTGLSATQATGFTQGRLVDWDGNGFGAYTGSNESTTDSQHAFDNVTSGCGSPGAAGASGLSANNSGCGGSIEGLLMNFSTKVNLLSLAKGWPTSGGDADAMVWAYTGTTAPTGLSSQTAAGSTTPTGTTSTYAAAMTGWTLVSSANLDVTNPTSTGSSLYSSAWLITTYFGAATGGLDAGDDRFKINAVTVGTCTGTLTGGAGGNGGNGATCTGSGTGVPEPNSIALAVLALAGAGVSRRRKAAAR